MSPRKLTTSIIAVAGAVALSLTSCSAKPASTDTPAPSASQPTKQLKVVTAFYALEFLAKSVGGDAVTVESLVAPGTEPHDLELTPKQIGELGSADLVFFQSGFQSAVDKAVKESKPKNVLDTSSFLKLIESDKDGHDHGEKGHDDKDGHDHGEKGHDDKDGHDHGEKGHDDKDGHDHGGVDPHTWLDPHNMVEMAKKFGEKLAEVNPAAKDTISKNTEATVKALTELDKEYADGLKTCKTRVFITQHAAFEYLAKRYQLDQEGIAGLDPEVEPTANRIKEIMEEAKENKVTTIFYETLVSDKVAKAIAKDLNLKTDVLDPLEGINDKSRGKDYIEVMKANLKALRTANECQ